MGMFSSKRKVQVATAVQRMIPDEGITLSGKIAVMRYLLESGGKTSFSVNDKTLPDYIIEALQNALPAKYNAAYRYAKKGTYAYGLPKASGVSIDAVDITDVTKQAIEADLGHSVDMVYAIIGSPNYQHFLWLKLIEQYGYNPTTNELENLSTSVGFPCYLKTGQLYYGNATINNVGNISALDQYGFSTESGTSIDRIQDFSREPVDAIVDTDLVDASAEITYEYIKVIPDVTAPDNAIINELSNTAITGYAEFGSTVVLYINDVLITEILADALGYFNFEFTVPLLPTDTVKTVVIDSANNESTGEVTPLPYTNPTPVTEGVEPTVSEVRHTETFSFDFLDYIPSDVYEEMEEADSTSDIYGDEIEAEYDYIQACYTYVVGGITHIGYLTYVYGSNTRMDLENLFTLDDALGDFYPRLYARLNAQNLPETLDKESAEYKTSKRMAKLLGLNWKDWSNNLHENVEGVNDVQQMFITLTAPMNTEDAVIQEYQYRYWLRMYDSISEYIPSGKLATVHAKIGKIMEVKDNVYSHGIVFDGISVHDVTGSIGEVGAFSSAYVNTDVENIRILNAFRGVYRTMKTMVEGDIPSYHAYRFQDTETTYKEVRVYKARSVHSFSGKSTTAVGTDENLIVPLDRTVLPRMTNNEREILFAKCFYLIINVKKVIKVKWYQRGAFKVVLAVAAIVMTVVTVGAGAPVSAYLVAAAKAVAVSLAVNIAITILVQLGISPELAGILAIVAMAYGGYLSINNTTGLLNVTAVEMLKITSYAFQMTTKASQYALVKLEKEMSSFQDMAREKEAALNKTKELLDGHVVDMDLELLLSSGRSGVFIRFGESPEMFLSNSVLNTITATTEYISNYVEMNLQPPNLQQILNKFNRREADGNNISL